MGSFLVAYSKLLSLKQNIPDSLQVEEYYAKQYDLVVDSLRQVLGDEVDEFRLADSEVKRIVSMSNYVTRETHYSDEKYCDRAKLLSQIDALLNYIALQSPVEDRKKIIGFRTQSDD